MDFMDTMWFVVLVGVLSFCAGIYCCPFVKRMLGVGCGRK
jgi:hypothetical protein